MTEHTTRNHIAAIVTGVLTGAFAVAGAVAVVLFIRLVTPDAVAYSRILFALVLLILGASGITALLRRRSR